MPEWNYEGQEALIYPGTTIFLYTDGLKEAENSNHTQFGSERIIKTAQQALSESPSCNPKDIIALQTEALHRFVGNAEQSDDLTMLAIRYNKPSHNLSTHETN